MVGGQNGEDELPRVIGVTPAMVKHFEAAKRGRGLLDYDDLILRTQALLEEAEDAIRDMIENITDREAMAAATEDVIPLAFSDGLNALAWVVTVALLLGRGSATQ